MTAGNYKALRSRRDRCPVTVGINVPTCPSARQVARMNEEASFCHTERLPPRDLDLARTPRVLSRGSWKNGSLRAYIYLSRGFATNFRSFNETLIESCMEKHRPRRGKDLKAVCKPHQKISSYIYFSRGIATNFSFFNRTFIENCTGEHRSHRGRDSKAVCRPRWEIGNLARPPYNLFLRLSPTREPAARRSMGRNVR